MDYLREIGKRMKILLAAVLAAIVAGGTVGAEEVTGDVSFGYRFSQSEWVDERHSILVDVTVGVSTRYDELGLTALGDFGINGDPKQNDWAGSAAWQHSFTGPIRASHSATYGTYLVQDFRRESELLLNFRSNSEGGAFYRETNPGSMFQLGAGFSWQIDQELTIPSCVLGCDDTDEGHAYGAARAGFGFQAGPGTILGSGRVSGRLTGSVGTLNASSLVVNSGYKLPLSDLANLNFSGGYERYLSDFRDFLPQDYWHLEATMSYRWLTSRF